MTVHVIKCWNRTHIGTGNWEEHQSNFTCFDGEMAGNRATNAMQALAFGFISDMMREGYTIDITHDSSENIRVRASKGEYREYVEYNCTENPELYPYYNRYSEHNEN